MSALEKIQLELSRFEKVQILRQELEDRQEELNEVEVQIRDKLQILETQRYLEGLSPYYAANPREGLPTREDVDNLEARRQQLADLVKNIEATLPVLLEGGAESAPQGTPSPAAGPARKAKFDSFDDFAKTRKPGQ